VKVRLQSSRRTVIVDSKTWRFSAAKAAPLMPIACASYRVMYRTGV
jgi:hypothetical protein